MASAQEDPWAAMRPEGWRSSRFVASPGAPLPPTPDLYEEWCFEGDAAALLNKWAALAARTFGCMGELGDVPEALSAVVAAEYRRKDFDPGVFCIITNRGRPVALAYGRRGGADDGAAAAPAPCLWHVFADTSDRRWGQSLAAAVARAAAAALSDPGRKPDAGADDGEPHVRLPPLPEAFLAAVRGTYG